MALPALPVAAVLAGAFLHAAWNVGIRGGADRNRSTILLLAGAVLIAVALLPFLPAPRAAAWPYLGRSALLHVLYFFLVAKAYQRAGVSLVYPAMRGVAPLLTTLIAVLFLGEALDAAAWMGILLICGGIVLMARGRATPDELVGLAAALLNAVIIAAYTVNDALGVRASDAPLSYTLWIYLLCAVPVALLLHREKSFCKPRIRELAYGVGAAACSIASYALALWALTRAPVAPIAALRETSMVFGVILAFLFLEERPGRRGWIAMIFIIAGAALLRLA